MLLFLQDILVFRIIAAQDTSLQLNNIQGQLPRVVTLWVIIAARPVLQSFERALPVVTQLRIQLAADELIERLQASIKARINA